MAKPQQATSRTYTVGGHTYLMTYFEAEFRDSGDPRAVADQFTTFVVRFAAEGWEFYRTDSLPYRVTPGCLGGFLGAKVTFGHSTIVSFRKPS